MQIDPAILNSPQQDQSLNPKVDNVFSFSQQSRQDIKKYLIRIFKYTDDSLVYDSNIVELGTQATSQNHTVLQNTFENLIDIRKFSTKSIQFTLSNNNNFKFRSLTPHLIVGFDQQQKEINFDISNIKLFTLSFVINII